MTKGSGSSKEARRREKEREKEVGCGVFSIFLRMGVNSIVLSTVARISHIQYIIRNLMPRSQQEKKRVKEERKRVEKESSMPYQGPPMQTPSLQHGNYFTAGREWWHELLLC